MPRVPTVIKWVGGKAQTVKKLFEHTPGEKPLCIIDAMAGSCAFALEASARYPDVPIVINDNNKQLVATLRCIRDHAEELAAMIEMTPYSRDLFHAAQQGMKDRPIETVADAVDWLVFNRQSVGGAVGHTGTGWSRDQAGKKITQWRKLPELIQEMGRWLCRVAYIECLDVEALLFGNTKTRAFGWDRPGVWIYFDFPYPGKEHYYDGVKLTTSGSVERQKHFAGIADRCEGNVLMSYMRDDFFEKHCEGWFPSPKWRFTSFEATQHLRVPKQGETKNKRTELLIRNYEGGASDGDQTGP